MSKKKRQPTKAVLQDANTEHARQLPPRAFGAEEMLAELEAIVSEAETRRSREELEA